MAVPRSKHTKSRRNKGRIHIFIKEPAISVCPKCGRETLSHTVCQNCGFYKGMEIINVLEKLDKKERKKREKEIKEREDNKTKSLTMEELSKNS